MDVGRSGTEVVRGDVEFFCFLVQFLKYGNHTCTSATMNTQSNYGTRTSNGQILRHTAIIHVKWQDTQKLFGTATTLCRTSS